MHKIVAQNKKAYHDFHIEEKYEAGIVLTGTEVKSCRTGGISIKESYARFIKGELILVNSHIAPYKQASIFNHTEKRMRKLLMNKKEIRKLIGKVTEKGYTLIPLSVYFNEKNLLKVEIGLARGKQLYDKREDLKKRDVEREMQRTIKGRHE